MEPITSLPIFPSDGSILTLAPQPIAFAEAYLLQPDGPNAGDPFRYSGEQINFQLWWYAIDEHGRFIYRRAMLRRSKGWGKSPFVGGLSLTALLGPTEFDGFDAYGVPVARPHPMPWVVIAGVSERQTDNTLLSIRAMSQESDLVADFGLDVGKTRILTPSGGQLVSVTASAATAEGARPTLAVLDEPHHWRESNGGWDLARVIRRNLAKVNGRSIETSNAHEPGQDSVAEDTYKAFVEMREKRTRGRGLLYDSREAPPLSTEQMADETLLREALRAAYGDSTWVDLDRLVGEVYDPNTPPEESRRFYLNQIVAAADAWLAPHELVFTEVLRPLEDRDQVVLGFDGGLTDDSSALVAIRVEDNAVFLVGLWENDGTPNWQVNKSSVNGYVDHIFAKLDVLAFFADVAYWENDTNRWRDEYGERLLVKATTKHAVQWDMRQHLSENTFATEALHRQFLEQEIKVFPDDRLKRHILNARRRPNRWGTSFGKDQRDSPYKVDALAALLLASMARTRVLADNVLSHGAGEVYGF